MSKLKYLFYELLAIPLLVPLVHISCFAENITSSSDGNDWEWLKLSTNETGNFTIENVIRDNLNRFTIQNLGNGNWTWTDNGYSYTNIFKMIMTNWPVPSYFWYWDLNGEIVFASSYFNRGVSPLYVCKTDNSNFTDYVKDNSCYTTNISELYSENGTVEFLTFGQETRSNLNIYNNNYLCFSFDNLNTYCVKCLTNGATCQGGETLLYTNNGDFSIGDYQNLAGTSPFIGGGDSGYDPFINSEEIYYSDNKQNYMDTFNAIGFYSGLCYSDFAINDIVSDSTSFGSFFPTFGSDVLSGATIFDLKNNLFSSWSNSAWFDNLNGYYKSVDKDFSRVSLYSGHSKGYFRLFYKLNNADFIDSYTLNGKDVFSYCDMVINGYDPSDLFTGSLSPSFENIYLSLRDNPYYLSGAVDPNGPKDLKGLFNQLFTNLKGSFKIDDTLEGTPGILPTYIIFGFFLFLLYYVFRK